MSARKARPRDYGRCQAIDGDGRCTKRADHMRYGYAVCADHNGHKGCTLHTHKQEDGTWTKE